MPCSRLSFCSLLLFTTAAALGCNGDSVTAPRGSGAVQVTTTTSGAEPDPDGYTVQIDGGPSQAIGVAASVHRALTPGNHTIQLGGLASNCIVADNPRPVSVTAGGSVIVTFEVTCSGPTGSIAVTSATTGAFPDQDGYSITIDGINRLVLQPTSHETIPDIPLGNHLVGLSGVSPNCRVNGTNPHAADLHAGETVAVAFTIDCSAPPPIAFMSGRGGGLGVYLVNPDGSGLIKVSPAGLTEAGEPAWSPDGRRIALASLGDLYIMNADGTGLRRLFKYSQNSPAITPRWSPDGRTLAFIMEVPGNCPDSCYVNEMWTIQADGTGLKKLAVGIGYQWSPDGKRLAFANDQIFVINADGSGLTQLTSVTLRGDLLGPAWSPDGTRLAFSTGGEIFTMNPDGTGLVQVSAGPVGDRGPVWSPDGTRIAFGVSIQKTPWDENVSLAVMNADGSGRLVLVRLAEAAVSSLAWSPNGHQIAFTLLDNIDAEPSLNNEVYTVNTDGTGLTDVSDDPAFDWGVTWSPR